MLSLILFNDRKTVPIPPQIHQNNSLILSYFLGKSDLIPKVTNMNFQYQLQLETVLVVYLFFLTQICFYPFSTAFFICLCTFNGNNVFLVQFCEHVFPVEEK